jgi:hypothetical protein
VAYNLTTLTNMSTNQDLNVFIRADSSGVKTGMNDAAAGVQSGTSRMRDVMGNLGSFTAGVMSGMRDEFRRMQEQAKSTSEETSQSFKGMGEAMRGSLSMMQSSFAGNFLAGAFTSALGSAKVGLHHLVLGGIEAAGALNDLSQQTGMSVESLNALGDVGSLSDTSIQTITSASNKLSVSLTKVDEEGSGAAAGLRALGIDFQAFQALSPEERMRTVATAMSEFKDGTDKTAVSIALFGKQGAALIPFFADLASAGDVQVRITKEQAAAADAFGDNLQKLKLNGEAWQKTLSLGMAPALRDASQAFLEVFTQAGGLKEQIQTLASDGSIDRWTRTAVVGFTYVIDALIYVKRLTVTVGEAIGAGLALASTMVSGIASAFSKISSGNLSGAVDAISGAYGEMQGIGKEFLADQEAAWGSSTLGDKIREAYAKGFSAGPEEGPKKNLSFKNASTDTKGDKATKVPSKMKDYEAELAELKVAWQEKQRIEGSFREFSKEQELAFWEQKRNVVTAGTQDEKAVRLKAANIRLAIDKDAFTLELAQMQNQMAEMRNNGTARVELTKQVAAKIGAAYGTESKEYAAAQKEIISAQQQAKLQLDQINAGNAKVSEARQLDLLAQEKETSQFRIALGIQSAAETMQIEQDFEARRYALRRDSIQASLALVDPSRNPVEYAKINSELEMLELQHQSNTRQIQNQYSMESIQQWNQVTGQIGGALQNSFASMLSNMKITSSGIKGLVNSMGSIFANTAAKMASDWVISQIKIRLASKQTTLAQLNNNAMAAAGAAYNAVVGIPYVGPFLAPVAAGVAYAGVMAFGSLASASGGYDIGPGVNPLTQLHEKEMVLPAHIAEPLRDSIDGGSIGGGGDVHFHGTPMKGGFWMMHQDDLVASLKQAQRLGKY